MNAGNKQLFKTEMAEDEYPFFFMHSLLGTSVFEYMMGFLTRETQLSTV